jgi:alcohol dehydrogenase class IV
MPNVMSFPTRIVHGRGAIRELPGELRRAGASRVLLVADKGIVQAGLLRLVTPALEQAGVPFAVFSEFEPNPTDADALRGIEAYRAARADSILAVGGGASLDMGKAIRLLVHHQPPLSQYDDAKGGDRLITPEQPPFLAVPTTAGTGSEVGRSTVLVIDGTKVVIFSPHLLADAAILDPELTVGLPPFVTAATGMDALTHNLEAYVAKGDHPLADAIALDGLRRIGKHLARAVKDGRDLVAREQMLLGSAMGAIAFQKGLGACHSVAHALTPVAGTHHGLANSLMLPAVIEFNRAAAEERLADAAVALGIDPRMSAPERAHACAQLVDDLRAACGLPRRLSEAGVKREMIPRIVEKSLADACHQSNPRPCGKEDFERLISVAF